jgi:undecaprenyl pyrophosphate synthase
MKWYIKLAIKILKSGVIPESIGIIMDGNRRYATKLKMKKHEGHAIGAKKLKQTLKWCLGLGKNIKQMSNIIRCERFNNLCI